jgi:hypothetical protein
MFSSHCLDPPPTHTTSCIRVETGQTEHSICLRQNIPSCVEDCLFSCGVSRLSYRGLLLRRRRLKKDKSVHIVDLQMRRCAHSPFLSLLPGVVFCFRVLFRLYAKVRRHTPSLLLSHPRIRSKAADFSSYLWHRAPLIDQFCPSFFLSSLRCK